MSKPASPRLRVHPAVAFTVIGLCIAILIWLTFPIFHLVGQYFLVIALLLAFRYWPPMIRWVKGMPVPHRIIFGLIITCMLLGHLTVRPVVWFPFTPWCIFPAVREDDPVTCREFIATTASGKTTRLLVEQLFPSVVQVYPLGDQDHFPPATLDRLVRALAKAYNARHADDPVRHVELVDMAVKLHPSENETRSEPSCELLRRYEISSDR